MLAALQADKLDDFAGPLFAGFAFDALHREGEGDVFQHREVGKQSEVLKHHAHLMAADFDELGFRQAEQIPSLELDRSGGRFDQSGQAAQEGRLAGAGQAHNDEDLALPYGQSRIADGANQICGAQFGGTGAAVAQLKKLLAARTEDFPDIFARQRDGARVMRAVGRGRLQRPAIGFHRSSMVGSAQK